MQNEIQKAMNPTEVSYPLSNGEIISLDAQTVRNFITNGDAKVTDKEIAFFVQLCKAQQLNPFLKEAYLIKYSEKNPATIVVSKDAFFKRAEAHPQYDGIKSGIIILDKDGKIIEREGTFHLQNESIVGGWAKVFRKDKKTETYDSVSFDEYAGKDSNGNLNSMWRSKPGTMIQKVAEVHALRKAFTEKLSGMYVEEEMSKSQVVSTMDKERNEIKEYDLKGMNQIDEEISDNNEEFEQYESQEDDGLDALMDEIAEKHISDFEENEQQENSKNNEPIEISYYEYVNNKQKYKLIPNSYDKTKKTCKVKIK